MTADDAALAIEAMLDAGKKVLVNTCGPCGYPCGYFRRHGHTFYDSGCGCVPRGPYIRMCKDDDYRNTLNINTGWLGKRESLDGATVLTGAELDPVVASIVDDAYARARPHDLPA